jgi:hypothetical protein
MHNHEQKICPRCKQDFECKPGNITQCQCFGIVIKPELRVFLEQQYNDCLCDKCLRYLEQDANLFNEKYRQATR